ncbi:MAG: type II secretion system minor pseudopilin GspK [Rhodoferax sp.]|nr:type II secretion system minor pseudopilin GspK [Rhodoferax sp.]
MRHIGPRGQAPAPQRGAALLLALLTVALVATLASAALWRHWRNVEVEQSERARMQAGWVLGGALDWARLILREDARAGGPDHGGEPWAVPLQESRISGFLALEPGALDGIDEVYLSGQITDAQARMNLRNLVADNKVSEPDQQAFARLFELLGLDASEIDTVAANLLRALTPVAAAPAAGASQAETPPDKEQPVPLLPRRLDQLAWLGLSAESARVLAPFITMLPVRTPVNVNTAPEEVLAASIPGIDRTDAQALVSARQRAPFRALGAVMPLLPAGTEALAPGRFSVGTRFFDVRGRLRMEQLVVEERSLLLRNGMEVSILWRERARAELPLAPAAAASATASAAQGPVLTMPP